MPVETVNNLGDIEKLRQRVHYAAALTRLKLITISVDPMEAIHTLKFDAYGFDPLLENGCLNLIEQLNQTFHTMASLAAAWHLLEWFPNCGGLHLNPTTTEGRDVESIDGNVEAEVFAAVNPRNNRKITKDIDGLLNSKAANRFVFFYCPSHCDNPGRRCELEREGSGVKVWALRRGEVM